MKQDVPSPNSHQDSAPMIKELARDSYQLYSEFQQGMLTMLTKAGCHEITPIAVMAGASTLLGKLTQGLQEQHRRIVAQMAVECDNLTEILRQQRSQREIPIDQGVGKRTMVIPEKEASLKRKRVQFASYVPIPNDQLSTASMIPTSPRKGMSKVLSVWQSRTYYERLGDTRGIVLCHSSGIAGHRTQDCQGYWACYT
ncbi:hypothetical protein NE237_030812 [Protea cynaroides]|uniref:Uncharacterized protein n=1 Tax=Protea cynaroides TaxID=273540 RepID=A0A9Q0GWV9_9MAGN|nr:hypothetical protein NE237_030812 [Protea cynaroides]